MARGPAGPCAARRRGAIAALAACTLLLACGRQDGAPPQAAASASSAAPAATAASAPAPSDPWGGQPGQLTLVLGDTGGPGDLEGRGTEARLAGITALVGEPGGSVVMLHSGSAVSSDLVRIAADGTMRDVFPQGIRLDRSPPGHAASDEPGRPIPLSRHYQLSAIEPAGDGGYFASAGDQHVVLRIGPDGIARVVAGRHQQAGRRDGGPGRNLLDSPDDLALARDGSLYIVDRLNAAIRRLAPDGRLDTFYRGVAGRAGRPNPDLRRPEPRAIAFDRDGRLWMIGRFAPEVGRNHAIYRLDAQGRIDLVVGQPLTPGEQDGDAASARFQAPYDLAADANGDLWVSEDEGHAAVRRITPEGQVTTVARKPCPGYDPCPALTPAWQGHLSPVLLGGGGERPFLAGTATAIYRLEGDGRIVPFAGRRGCEPPTDGPPGTHCLGELSQLAWHPDGSLIAMGRDAVQRITPDRRITTLLGPEVTIEFPAPAAPGASAPYLAGEPPVTGVPSGGLAVDGRGRIHFGLSFDQIAVREPDGRLRLASAHPFVPPPRDSPDMPDHLQDPRSFALLPDGRLLVAEYAAHVLRRLDPADGRLDVVAGRLGEPGEIDGRAGQARLRSPHAVALAPDGTAYVGDAHGIRVVRPDGSVQTLPLGTGVAEGGCSDGGVDVLARAADGTLWFAAGMPTRVWRLRPGGTPEWIAGDRIRQGVRPGPLPGHLWGVSALLPTPDGGVLIASGRALLKATPARPAGKLASAGGAGGCGRG